jgi:predicted GNAT family acetyltransferase
MNLVRHSGAEAFLLRAGPWLLRAEAENNLILGIARAIAANSHASAHAPYLATIERGGEIVACALRAPPHKLLVTRCTEEALALLIEDMASLDRALPAVLGTETVASQFAQVWTTRRGQRVRTGKRQRIHELRQASPGIPQPAGNFRPAQEPDLELVIAWTRAFLKEGDIWEPTDPAQIARDRLSQNGLFLWENGEPVSVAACGGKTPNGIRINLVYTPPQQRRRGYASACVAALTRRLLQQGNQFCCLFTDLANPVSNSIYRRIGYQPVCDMCDYFFEK